MNENGPSNRQHDQRLIDALRSDLEGFTVAAVDDLLGPLASHALGREQSLPAQRVVRSHPGDVLARLTGLFVLGQPLTRAALDQALPRLGVAGAAALQLVAAAGEGPDDEVRSLVDLRPYAAVDDSGPIDWWIVSDPGELATGKALQPDHVLGVGGASVTLARCTIRRPVGSVLDLGTGCGVQALHAARHAREVTGTDVSYRALTMARLNWDLNAPTLGGARFDALHGNMFEPVAGRRFDLVVSNPPFVITPRGLTPQGRPGYEYRDGGLVGDDIVRRMVTGVGQVLAPGGVAQFLGNWEIRRGDDWRARVQTWLDEADASGAAGAPNGGPPGGQDASAQDASTQDDGPIDAWVIQREVQDPAEYAETWIRDAGQHLGPGADALYEAWLDDFASRDVEGIGFGLITLRRPGAGPSGSPAHLGSAGSGTAGPARRLEELRGGPGLPSGAVILGGLAAHDWLAAHDDDALLGAALQVAPDVTEERHHLPGAEDPSVILLRQGGGAQRVVQASTALAGFTGACSAELTTGQLIGALAQLLERDEPELRAELLPQVRSLVADGLLLP